MKKIKIIDLIRPSIIGKKVELYKDFGIDKITGVVVNIKSDGNVDEDWFVFSLDSGEDVEISVDESFSIEEQP